MLGLKIIQRYWKDYYFFKTLSRVASLKKYIKTKCGIDKYHQLKAETGLYNYARFIWFFICASIRDALRSKKKQRLKMIVLFEILVASAAFNLDVNSSKYINSNYLIHYETDR